MRRGGVLSEFMSIASLYRTVGGDASSSSSMVLGRVAVTMFG